MVLVALKCPHCGGTVQMEDSMKSGFCVHCGSKIINEPNISGSVSIDRSADIVNHLKVAKETLTLRDWEKATPLVENAMLIDSNCEDAWCMKALLCYRDKAQYENILTRIKSKEFKSYGVFSEDSIKKCWGELDVRIYNTSKSTMTTSLSIMPITVSIDGKQSSSIGSGQSTMFGVNPGRHIISACIDMMGTKTMLSELSFVANKNHEVEIRSKAAKISFTKVIPPTIEIVQIS